MKLALKAKLKAQLTVALIAGAVAQVSALLLSATVNLSPDAVSPTALVLYGAATVLLIYRCVIIDARRAFSAAVKKRYVIVEGTPPRISWIRPIFPGHWLARLHIRLHPELGDDKET
ncbi:hypothetical protein [Paraburkholderia youngii]|uniref:Uncharacterized protein n=1 Tax=Paraburkholderia youngii TaxID=2782701 RepID=A0A7W8P1M3_9BURK|nr:hypothetical protein [Paraburkholderia youngii]MBB5399090.1 hypothetical protein [Paraburkholderia youngii]NUX56153.1 hypothetical protein [Paraburkholderia youngii]